MLFLFLLDGGAAGFNPPWRADSLSWAFSLQRSFQFEHAVTCHGRPLKGLRSCQSLTAWSPWTVQRSPPQKRHGASRKTEGNEEISTWNFQVESGAIDGCGRSRHILTAALACTARRRPNQSKLLAGCSYEKTANFMSCREAKVCVRKKTLGMLHGAASQQYCKAPVREGCSFAKITPSMGTPPHREGT